MRAWLPKFTLGLHFANLRHHYKVNAPLSVSVDCINTFEVSFLPSPPNVFVRSAHYVNFFSPLSKEGWSKEQLLLKQLASDNVSLFFI